MTDIVLSVLLLPVALVVGLALCAVATLIFQPWVWLPWLLGRFSGREP